MFDASPDLQPLTNLHPKLAVLGIGYYIHHRSPAIYSPVSQYTLAAGVSTKGES